MVECHSTLNFFGNVHPSSLEQYRREVQPKVDAFEQTKAIGSVYLDENQDRVLSEALGCHKEFAYAIWSNLPTDQLQGNVHPRDKNWGQFVKSYDEAVNCVRSVLNPKILEQIEKLKG